MRSHPVFAIFGCNTMLTSCVFGSQADAFARSKGLQLVGYYQANAHIDDVELGSAGKKITERIQSHTPQACALLVSSPLKWCGAIISCNHIGIEDQLSSWPLLVTSSLILWIWHSAFVCRSTMQSSKVFCSKKSQAFYR